MGYADLLRGLEEETARQAAALREEGAREADRLTGAARAEAGRHREEALGRARDREEAAARRARADAERDAERLTLEAVRELLEAARGEALRLLSPRAAELLPRLLAEAVPAAEEGQVEVRVDPGEEERARAWLARERPGLRASVAPAPATRGGVEVHLAGAVLDDTFPARLEKAWPEVEGRAAALLLEGTGGADAGL